MRLHFLSISIGCVVSLLASQLAACADEREREPRGDCTTWQDHVQPVVQDACATCHREPASAGDYDLSSYLGALGTGSDDVANAIAGDPASLVLQRLAPAGADATHAPFAEVHELLSRWVVDCELAYADSRIHRPGIMNPVDDGFHGHLLETLRWDFDQCAECHGADFSGGTSGATCLDCHERGPTDCTTCHGLVMDSGAHLAHTGAGPLGASYDCSACHSPVPEDYRDPGHLFVMGAPDLVDPPPADVVFGDLAIGSNNNPAAPPTYDPATGRCDNIYCHGATFDDQNALNTAPEWLAQDQASCGSCHGLAPSSHAPVNPGQEQEPDRCVACHPLVVTADRSIRDPTLHIDDAISVGANTGDPCTDCHGPPRDLAGRIDPANVTVGAHVSHTDALHGLRGPIPCSDCHPMPAELSSPGHIDSAAPAELFWSPTGPFSSLATRFGAVPVWDRVSATCADVYCHGGGTSTLADDQSPDLMRTPVWTALNTGQAACGTCHGAPPITVAHTVDMTLDTCHTCHGATVDDYGNIIIISDPMGELVSEHIDGKLDL